MAISVPHMSIPHMGHTENVWGVSEKHLPFTMCSHSQQVATTGRHNTVHLHSLTAPPLVFCCFCVRTCTGDGCAVVHNPPHHC